MKKLLIWLMVIVTSGLFWEISFANSDVTLTEEERLRQEEINRELERLVPLTLEEAMTRELERLEAVAAKKAFFVKFGGWLNITYRHYKETDNQASLQDTFSSSWLNELKFWMMLSYYQNYRLYLRLKDSYISRNTDRGYTGIGGNCDGPYLDVGYFVDNAPYI